MASLKQPGKERPYLKGALLVVLVVLAYFPALHGQFLWDDDDNVINNRTLRSVDGLRRIWFEPGATQQYYPLTHTSFWLDYHLWGMSTTGYHAVNILLHAFSALLLWWVLMRLEVPGGWWGAALFAVHPVCVETVAWITERKNTLCGVFFLGSILCSVQFWLPAGISLTTKKKPLSQKVPGPDRGEWKYYGLALFLYLCALWAKTAAVGLPAVIVLLWWWKRARIVRRDLVLLLPFLAAGLAMGLITMWVEKHDVGATGQEWHFSWMERCLIAGRALWFYLGKLLLPYPLAFMYPRWVIQASQPIAYVPLAALLAGILILWRKRDNWARPVLFAAGFFIAMLFPVLGFFDVFFFRFSFVCDHFQYLACIAPLALAGSGLARCIDYLGKRSPFPKEAVGGALLLILGLLTWRQTGVYRDIETLWRETLAHNANSWMAHNNLGNALLDKGNIQEAAEQYNQALRIKPDYAAALNNLGNALLEQGKVDEAILQINQALQLDPKYPNSHYNLGLALSQKGEFVAAIGQYNEALRYRPDYFSAYNNVGNLLVRQGKLDEAILQYTLALQLEPDAALTHDNLGHVLASRGNLKEAIPHYLQALQIDPNLADAHYHLGVANAGQGNLAEAIQQYNEALRLKPDYALAHKSLGNALVRQGNLDEAAQHYQKALQIQPGFADAHYNLGVILAKAGKLDLAREQFAEAVKLKPDYTEAAKQLRALTP